ncbi:MAG: DNA repair protein RecN, partial [Casimicrobiaceae bacterium]
GIGGAVAATVGRLLQALGATRQVLCVTHLPQVAAHADHHFLVQKLMRRTGGKRTPGDGSTAVSTELSRLAIDARVEELARMLGGAEITATTRAHAQELFEQHRRAATEASGRTPPRRRSAGGAR